MGSWWAADIQAVLDQHVLLTTSLYKIYLQSSGSLIIEQQDITSLIYSARQSQESPGGSGGSGGHGAPQGETGWYDCGTPLNPLPHRHLYK